LSFLAIVASSSSGSPRSRPPPGLPPSKQSTPGIGRWSWSSVAPCDRPPTPRDGCREATSSRRDLQQRWGTAISGAPPWRDRPESPSDFRHWRRLLWSCPGSSWSRWFVSFDDTDVKQPRINHWYRLISARSCLFHPVGRKPACRPHIAILTRSNRRAARAVIGGSVRRLRANRRQCRAKSQSGAPRLMKMGNTRSPFPYDPGALALHPIGATATTHEFALRQDRLSSRLPSWSGYPSIAILPLSFEINVMCHVWTAPSWQGKTSRRRLGRCNHVFGLLARFPWPLAIMPSADPVPVKSPHSTMHWHMCVWAWACARWPPREDHLQISDCGHTRVDHLAAHGQEVLEDQPPNESASPSGSAPVEVEVNWTVIVPANVQGRLHDLPPRCRCHSRVRAPCCGTGFGTMT